MFGKYIYYNDETFSIEITDIKGNHKSYISTGSNIGLGFKIIDNKLYDLDNKLIVDLDEYDVVSGVYALYESGYVIVSEQIPDAEGNAETVYYSVFAPEGKKTKLDTSKDNWGFVGGNEYGYQISYTVTDDAGVTKTYYELYSPLNKLIVKSESQLYYAGDILLEDWTMTLYVTDDGTYYVVE